MYRKPQYPIRATFLPNRSRLAGKVVILVASFALVAVLLAGCTAEGIVTPDAAQGESLSRVDGAAKAHVSTSLVWTFPDGAEQIDGASASLTRTKNGVNYRFATNSLLPDHAYTLWVVIFNKPDECPTAPCSPMDLFNAAAMPDMLFGAGLVVGVSGEATFAGRTKVGDASGSVQAPIGLAPNGLMDPYGAEFHFVVHHHGPKIAEFMPDMIQTLAGGCTDSGIPGQGVSSPWNDYDNAGLEYGRFGPNACESVQFAVLQP